MADTKQDAWNMQGMTEGEARNFYRLSAALGAARETLTPEEVSSLKWLASCERGTVENLAAVLRKATEYGTGTKEPGRKPRRTGSRER